MTRLYDTAAWKKIQKAQLDREPVCQGCEEAPATVADHIVPIARGGAKRERANLQSLCCDCHQEKTNTEKAGRRWIPRKHKGCDVNGMPRDPLHPWNVEQRRALH